MPRYLFSSHDGFGLGHVRRNSLVARALLDADPAATATLVTGVPVRPGWLSDPRLDVVQVPALLKDSVGGYRHDRLPFEEVIGLRARTFLTTVRDQQPDVVVVDRHPFGTGGELRPGLVQARRQGARIVLGLRDILDEPGVVREELAGRGWADVPALFDEVLVYGERHLCDQEAEYGLPVPPRYTGWVAEALPPAPLETDLLIVTAGGGGDGAAVFGLGLALLRSRPDLRGRFVAGPYAGTAGLDAAGADPDLGGRVEVTRAAPACAEAFRRAGSVLQMAGYNSTFEALAAGLRPILVPRRTPRREQAIRALRLAALGLADVVDEGAAPAEVAWLLDQPRRLAPGAATAAGVTFDGAARAAQRIAELAGTSARRTR